MSPEQVSQNSGLTADFSVLFVSLFTDPAFENCRISMINSTGIKALRVQEFSAVYATKRTTDTKTAVLL